MNKEILEWIKSIIIAVVLALLLKQFVFYSVLVNGASMEPTLHHNDRLFANKLALYFKGPKRGDIVSFKAPDADKNYIKRVVGLAGDRIELIDGIFYLNDEKLEENYTEEFSFTENYGETYWEVEEGQVFVVGDNRLPSASNDSRAFGPIDIESIDGISNFRYYPIDKNFGRLNK